MSFNQMRLLRLVLMLKLINLMRLRSRCGRMMKQMRNLLPSRPNSPEVEDHLLRKAHLPRKRLPRPRLLAPSPPPAAKRRSQRQLQAAMASPLKRSEAALPASPLPRLNLAASPLANLPRKRPRKLLSKRLSSASSKRRKKLPWRKWLENRALKSMAKRRNLSMSMPEVCKKWRRIRSMLKSARMSTKVRSQSKRWQRLSLKSRTRRSLPMAKMSRWLLSTRAMSKTLRLMRRSRVRILSSLSRSWASHMKLLRKARKRQKMKRRKRSELQSRTMRRMMELLRRLSRKVSLRLTWRKARKKRRHRFTLSRRSVSLTMALRMLLLLSKKRLEMRKKVRRLRMRAMRCAMIRLSRIETWSTRLSTRSLLQTRKVKKSSRLSLNTRMLILKSLWIKTQMKMVKMRVRVLI